MPIKIINEPTVEPITLQEAKDHLRVGRNLSTITIFDADNPLGLTWGDLFITVK